MNYYEHHLGDYVRDTAHLSILEDGTYRRLLDAYYIREQPLPPEPRECCKLARATSKAERAAVSYILGGFFELLDDGWHQARADAEIARYQGKQGKARASADARWNAKRTQSERNANASSTEMRTHSERNADAMRTHSERNANGYANGMPPAGARGTHPGITARPSPVPSNQTPGEEKKARAISESIARARKDEDEDPDPDVVGDNEPTAAGLVCRAMRHAGIAAVNPSDQRLRALLEQGATLPEFEDVAAEAAAKGKGFAWVLGAVEGRRGDAASIALAASVAPPSHAAEKTQQYLRAQRMTPEEQTAADTARKRVMAERGEPSR